MTIRFTMVLVPLFSAISLVAMDQLTAQEQECFNWFDQQRDLRSEAVQAMAPENYQNMLVKNLQYSEYPDQVKSSIDNLAEEFCKRAHDKKYTPAFLSSSLLKMKIMMQQKAIEKPIDLLTARMYVWSKKLTQEEQDTVLESNFKSNRSAAEKVIQKFSSLLADEKITLGLIKEEEKVQDSQSIFVSKMEELDRIYNSKQ